MCSSTGSANNHCGGPRQGQPGWAAGRSGSSALQGVNLLGRNNRVGPRQELLALRLVVEGARVLLRVAVLRAEEEFALALEAQEANLLVAGVAPARVDLLLRIVPSTQFCIF